MEAERDIQALVAELIEVDAAFRQSEMTTSMLEEKNRFLMNEVLKNVNLKPKVANR